jgi:Asp-tRNA(Asn)/Glu-tRNA(Gln) amidotransferase B subunit
VELPSTKIDTLIAGGVAESAAKIIVANQVMLEYLDQVKKIDPEGVAQAAKDLVNKKVDYAKVSPEEYLNSLQAKSAGKITDESVLKPIIEKIIADNPTVVADYKAGKQNALGFFVGAVMKQTAGKADAAIVNKLLASSI